MVKRLLRTRGFGRPQSKSLTSHEFAPRDVGHLETCWVVLPGTWGMEARDAASHPTARRTAPLGSRTPPDIHSAEAGSSMAQCDQPLGRVSDSDMERPGRRPNVSFSAFACERLWSESVSVARHTSTAPGVRPEPGWGGRDAETVWPRQAVNPERLLGERRWRVGGGVSSFFLFLTLKIFLYLQCVPILWPACGGRGGHLPVSKAGGELCFRGHSHPRRQV